MTKKVFFTFVTLLVINSVELIPTKDINPLKGKPDVERLNNLRKDDLAEQFSGKYQGDMILSQEQLDALNSDRHGRTGLIDKKYSWLNNIVPYYISENYFTTAQKNYITRAFQKLMDVTCLKFVRYNKNAHANYINITGKGGDEGGCYSAVGMQGGQQQLNLEPYDIETGCFRLYTIVHELIHAIGFFHMQTASERDEYVKIVWENIKKGMEGNFRKLGAGVISQYGYAYDYGSVMHYSKTSFSKNDKDTIVPLKDLGNKVMGQRSHMTASDIGRINAKYCKKSERKN